MQTKQKYKVAIVILNYNGWFDTVECLESLLQVDYTSYKIIIVDNGSTDDSVKKIERWFQGEIDIQSDYISNKGDHKQLKTIKVSVKQNEEVNWLITRECDDFFNKKDLILVETGVNLGFSGGNNVGARLAVENGADFVILLNNDTIVLNPDFISRLVDAFHESKNVYVVGPNIINFDRTFDGPFRKDTFWGEVILLTIKNQLGRLLANPSIYIDIQAISSPHPVPVYKISGACMVFRASFLKETNYLDENVWLSCEEAIVAEKVIAKKGTIMFQPLTTLLHKKGRSPRGNKTKRDILRNHFKQREYFLRTYKKYGPIKIQLIKFTQGIRLMIEDVKLLVRG